jgi:hypothetical protein
MDARRVIKRYLDPDRFERVKTDLKPLVRIINNSYGEYNFQLRENYFDIYYQGNALAKVTPNTNGTYSTVIHKEFLTDRIRENLKKYSSIKESTGGKSQHVRFVVRPRKFHQFFQSNHLKSISGRIRKRGYGEEITFEQVLITDNPPSDKFIIIDRQVAEHKNKAQIDLLALRRDSEDKPFHFVVIEVKLGRNPELHEKVGSQLNGYVRHIRKYIKDYVDCYRENYRQKKELGLFDPFSPNLPAEIEIDESENSVEGLIVVGGYSQLAEKALGTLRRKIREKGWPIKVQQMRNEIRLDNRSDCQEP